MSTAQPISSVPDDTMPQRVIRSRTPGEPQTARPPEPVRLSDLLTWSYVRAGVVGEVLQWAHRGTSRAGRLLTGRRPRHQVGELDPVIDVSNPGLDFVTLEVLGRRTLKSGAGAPELRLSLRGASVVRGRRRRELSLSDLWLDGAGPVHGQLGPRKAPDTVWEADISGADSTLQVRGPWLHVAALGMLAGWPEPA